MKVVLTGAQGGVGTIVSQIAASQNDIELAAFSREQLDITDPGALMSCFMHEKPDYVINAAAFTHVDKGGRSADGIPVECRLYGWSN